MTEFIHLTGSEAVENAGRSISSAAQDMKQAVAYFSEELQRHRLWADEWLGRLEEIMKKPGGDGSCGVL